MKILLLTTQDVKKLLVSVLERITGLEPGRVIWEAGGGPRPPEGLYCSLWWKRFEPLTQNEGAYRDVPDPDTCDKTTPILQVLRNETWCEVQVSFWGPGAFDMAALVVGRLQNDNRNFDLWHVLGYGGIDAIQDISSAFGGRIQSRCFFNLSFYACFGAEYPVAWFDVSQWGISHAGRTDAFEYSKEDGEIHPEDCSRPQGEHV